MKWLNRLEKPLGRFAIPHIMIYIIFFQSLAYIFAMASEARNPQQAADFLSRLMLDGRFVWHEPWRIVTFVMIPSMRNPIFFFFAMYFLFFMGNALENHWGTFRFNLYLLIGWAATVAVAIALPTGPATNMALMQSIFLAFAILYPDFQILMFFVFPVKVKYLAVVVWISYLFMFFDGSWLQKLVVLASIANFLLFFHAEVWQLLKGVPRRVIVRPQAARSVDEPFNRCTTCGVTEKSNPRMEFRYCAQCAGTLCYCLDHIHAHVHRGASESVKA